MYIYIFITYISNLKSTDSKNMCLLYQITLEIAYKISHFLWLDKSVPLLRKKTQNENGC